MTMRTTTESRKQVSQSSQILRAIKITRELILAFVIINASSFVLRGDETEALLWGLILAYPIRSLYNWLKSGG